MRRWLSRLWIAITLGWAMARIVIAGRFLEVYGLNVAWFAAVEIISTLVFAYSSSRFLTAVWGRRAVAERAWALPTLLGFVAPDAYMFTSTHHMPQRTLIAVLVFVVVSALLGAVAFLQELRAGRSELPGYIGGVDVD